MKELILITSSFPKDNGEPFLKNEYPYLKEKFDKIDFVVVSNTIPNDLQVSTFDEHDVVEMRINTTPKVKLIVSGIFNRLFWRESIYILSNIKLRYFFSSLKVAIVSLDNAKLIRRVLQNKLASSQSNSVVIYSYWGDGGAIAAAQLADDPKVHKVVTRVHGWDVYFEIHSPPYLPFRSFLQKKCDAIYPISAKGKLTIENVWKVPSDNVTIERLGVNVHKNVGRREDGVFTVMSCSNVIPLKRVQLIAEAILEINLPIKWIHFGDGTEFTKVTDLVEKRKLAHHDIALVGKVDHSIVLDFYKKFRVDLFVNVSTSEGIPVAIMEAMSHGTPVLATDVGGTSEIVDNDNGELLKVDIQPDELAARIISFYHLSTEEQDRKRECAFETCRLVYDAKTNFDRFANSLAT